jgi:vesicle coat complex subunit
LFVQRPKDGHELITNLLKKATTECENPDLRDRAYIYLRILNLDPELARKIVFAERPPISD